MKKLVIAAVALSCAVAPVIVGGCGQPAPAQLEYTLSESGDYYIVSGVSGGIKSFTSCTVPATYAGEGGAPLPVKEIGDEAFAKCYRLSELVLPDGITAIGDHAFIYCAFSSFTIPEGVESIGVGAFGSCEKLQEIEIPKSVKVINKQAFIYCSGLKKAVIKADITTLEEQVFYNSNPQNAGMTYINTSLKEIYLPATLKKARADAFWGNALESVYFEGSREEWEDVIFYKMQLKENSKTEYFEKTVEKEEALGEAAKSVKFNVSF